MSNTLGITEVTLTELIATGGINTSRTDMLKPLVVRVTGHDDDVGAETDDPDKMALFCSRAQGHPWIKEGGQKRVTFEAKDGTTPCTSDATYVIPFIDYTTYE